MIKWNKLEHGHVISKCGRFSIIPECMGRIHAQQYDVQDMVRGDRIKTVYTQAEGKAYVEQYLLKREGRINNTRNNALLPGGNKNMKPQPITDYIK